MPGESILTPIQRSVGVSAIKDSIYKEIEFRKETIMNEVIKAGEVFKLAELLLNVLKSLCKKKKLNK